MQKTKNKLSFFEIIMLVLFLLTLFTFHAAKTKVGLYDLTSLQIEQVYVSFAEFASYPEYE